MIDKLLPWFEKNCVIVIDYLTLNNNIINGFSTVFVYFNFIENNNIFDMQSNIISDSVETHL